jgi:PleD family two-component response regulator
MVKDSRSIIPSATGALTKPASGLIHRGLLELSSLEPERLVVPPAQKARILVCDDEEAFVEVISTLLLAAGYEVRSTINSLDAIEIAREFQPHVAILGEVMPRMDGITLALELTKFLSQTKMVLTAEAEATDRQIFHEQGWSFDVFAFPFKREELLEKTRGWVDEAFFYDLATGLYNERHFQFILETEIFRSERYGYTFSIIFCKIRPSWNLTDDDDSIAKQNRLLAKIADRIRPFCRLVDYGFYLQDGDFALLLLQTGQESGSRTAELLRKMFEESEWEDGGAPLKINPTITHVSFPEDGKSKAELLARSGI